MAITLRSPNGTTTVAYGTRTNTVVSRPSGMAAGDVAVVITTCGGSTLVQPSGPAGSELMARVTYTAPDPWAVDLALWVVPYSAGASWTFTHASRSTQAYAIALVGVDGTTMQDVAASTAFRNQAAGGPTTATAPSITTVTDGAWVIAARGSWDGNAITAPAGFTERYDVPVGWLGDREQATAGATGDVAVPTGNGSNASPWGVIQGALRPAGAGGGESYTGTLSASVPRVTGSLAGTVSAPTFTGTLSASTPRVTATLTGTVTSPSSTGSIAATTPRVTSSIAGTVTPPTYSGTMSGTLPKTTGSMSGTVTPPTYSGTLTAAIPPTRSTITGTVTTPDGAGSLSATLPRVTGSIGGTITAPTWTGTLDGELAALSGSALGIVTGPAFTGTLDGTLPAVTGALSGTVTAPTGSGTLTAVLPLVTGSLTGVVQVDDDLVPASARIVATKVRAPSARGIIRGTDAHGTIRTPTAQGRLR